jgi:putative inorganic carbon (HCO3(-)) transporter
MTAGLLAGAAGLAVVFPPEVHPEAGAGVALLLAAGLLAAGAGRLRLAPVCVGLALAGFNLSVSFAPGTTLGWLARLALPAAALALAWQLPPRLRRWPLLAIVAAGAAVAAYGVYQAAGGLLATAEQARAMGMSGEAVFRLEQGRAFATHALPASLAGVLTLALAASAALIATALSRHGRIGAGIAAGVIAAGLLATGSLGAWVGLVVGGAVVVSPRLSAWPRRRLAAVLAAAVVVLALLALIKPGSVLDLDDPNHPLSLRADNWVGAVRVGLEQPAAGTGLGSFGSLYPSVRTPGDNETVYAHNSWLQLAVEGGLPALVLLVAALWALWRRCRDGLGPEALWSLAGVAAFAAHNLVDFTAYLPGVAVPAMVLAGLAFAPRQPPHRVAPFAAQEPQSRARGWIAAVVLAVVLAGAAWLFVGEGTARAQLARADRLAREGRALEAADAAAGVSDRAPWLRPVHVRAGNLLLGGGEWHQRRAAALARALIRLDPASPSPWHLLGNVEAARGHPVDAWRALESAGDRHPADGALRDRVKQVEHALHEAGLFARDLDYGGQAPPAELGHGPRWGDVLLLIGIAMATLVAWRWWRPGPAPAAAFALALALLLASFGEGGALPGARLAWIGLLALGLLATRELDTRLPAALAPAAFLAALSAALAPAPAPARDGLVALLAVLVALMLSAEMGRARDGWLDLVISLLGVAAGLQAALVLVQRVGGWLGAEVTSWIEPFAAARAGRPDADFLHPGHLGTFMVAVGLALIARGWARRPGFGASVGLGAALVALGVTQGARASVLALVAGGAVLVLIAARGRARLGLGLAFGAAAAAGAGAAALRIGSDPFAWSRLEIWRASLHAIEDRPWLGFGPGGFGPFGSRYVLEDPGPIARFAKVFHQPHSDPLDALVSLGVLGALALAGGLGWLLLRALRHRSADAGAEPARAAAWVALTGLAAHGLVDGFLGQRPVIGLAAALLLGGLAGPALRDASRTWRAAGLARALAAAGVVTAFLGGEALPWLAYRVDLEGQPRRAARIDPLRTRYWVTAARSVTGAPDRRLALALQRVERAALAAPGLGGPWKERARVLDAACRGPLAERDTCQAALASWSAVTAREPRDVFARRSRARLRRALGDGAAARADLRLALSMEPSFLGARIDLIRLLIEGGDLPAARRELAALQERAAALDGARPGSDRARELLRVDPRAVRSLARALSPAPAPEADP